MYEFLLALLLTWPIHAIPAGIIAIPTILLTRRRMKWYKKDGLALAFPWLMWVLVFAFNRRPASLTSALFESLLLGSVVGLNFITLVVLAHRFNPYKMRLALMALMCSIAVLLCAFFPVLGE
jgi:hypothetical protein